MAISLVSLTAATLVGVTTGENLADDLNEERLRAAVESAAWDVETELRTLERTTGGLAESLQATAAIEVFGEAFDELEADIDASDIADELEQLFSSYQDTYIEPLRATGRQVQLRDIAGGSAAAGYLQYEYAVDLGVVSRPSTIDDAGDESAWTAIHRRIHPVYRDVVTKLDLVDLYLVDRSGRVLYSVNKRADLGTNLRTGPFSGSVVANAFTRVIDTPDAATLTSDLRFYDPVPGTPIGVVGSPIGSGEPVGALLISYDASRLTDLVTANEAWEEAGLPETSDVYVIGADGLTRTDPRMFLETPGAFLDAVSAIGRLSDEARDIIRARGTTVLEQAAIDDVRDAGVDDDASVRDTGTLVGSTALSITVPVDNAGVEWFVVAEIDAAVAGRGLDDFQELLVVGTAIFLVLLAFLAVGWANSIVRPIRHISDRISRQGREHGDIAVPPHTPVEIQQLATQLGLMRTTLADEHERISEARSDRLGLLRSLLPPSVADRIVAGDVHSFDRASAASVAVVVVLGLADLVDEHGDGDHSPLVGRIVNELDDLASARGCDRIKVVGDAFFVACGHDRPFIDHAPRTVGFAVDAVEAIADLDSNATLGLAIGIHSGPVTTGMAGGASLVYDVWGTTVGQANRLARSATAGQIRVSEASRALLPDAFVVEPIDGHDEYLVTSAVTKATTS